MHLIAAACTPAADPNHRSTVEPEFTRDAALRGAADAIRLAHPLRLQSLEPKEEGRHSVGEIDYAALQTGKERAVGTPKPRWGCCGHKILESRDEGELGYARWVSKSKILV